jgi:hypothetical protein
MTTRAATAAEVRDLYKMLGHTARINREGHVEFRRDGEGPWLDGGRVSEYHTDEASLPVIQNYRPD